jgi:hypothetical protein
MLEKVGLLSQMIDSIDLLAEGEGFEPPVPFQAQRFSRPPVSTAHPSLRGIGFTLYPLVYSSFLCLGASRVAHFARRNVLNPPCQFKD